MTVFGLARKSLSFLMEGARLAGEARSLFSCVNTRTAPGAAVVDSRPRGAEVRMKERGKDKVGDGCPALRAVVGRCPARPHFLCGPVPRRERPFLSVPECLCSVTCC